MVSVSSLGIQSPVALPFLISEQVLPEDAGEDHYDLHTTQAFCDSSVVEDELVVTQSCVAWSRNGILRRLFRFDAESEAVSQALFTNFYQTNNRILSSSEDTTSGSKLKVDERVVPSHVDQSSGQKSSRALVVILKTQAHVFFLSGTTNVVHLPFEVESALPAPQGLLLQRKGNEHSGSSPSVSQQTVTPSQYLAAPSRSHGPLKRANDDPNPYSETAPPELFKALPSFSLPASPIPLPSSFTLVDPLLELGLVAIKPGRGHSTKRGNRKPLSAIDPAERIVYISPAPEPLDDSTPNESSDGPIVVLTVHGDSGKYTFYSAEYVKSDPLSATNNHKAREGLRAKRRSSFGPAPGTGATTPIARHSHAGGESFITSNRVISQSSKAPPSNQEDSSYIDPLVSTLELEFERRGAPARDSRRVSSLLARSDLSTSHDKQTFSDLATGNASLHGQGPVQAFRRGDSLGPHNLRTSFGQVIGSTQRRSTSGLGIPTGRVSGSFHDPPVEDLLEELSAGGDFEGFESMGLQEVVEGLKREMILTPVVSIPQEQSFDFRHIAEKKPLKVFTLSEPPERSDVDFARHIVMCVVDQDSQKLHVFTFQAHIKRRNSDTAGTTHQNNQYYLTHSDHKKGGGVLDAAKVRDGPHSRILVLTETPDGQRELTLQAPWSPLVKITLPQTLTVWNSHAIGYSPLSFGGERRLRRILSQRPKSINGLTADKTDLVDGKVVVVDELARHHLVQLQMRPSNPQVSDVLDLCRTILPSKHREGEALLVCWWEVKYWLESRENSYEPESTEWIALVITFFCLIVHLVPPEKVQPTPHPRKTKRPFLRSSSGATTDWSDWDSMLKMESSSSGPVPDWLNSSSWSWMLKDGQNASKVVEGPLMTIENAPYHTSDFLVEILGLTRAFIESPEGTRATGFEGYLPTAQGKPDSTRQNTVPLLLIALHLFREDKKLDITNSYQKNSGPLLPVLAQLGAWLSWENWGFSPDSYYSREEADLSRWSYDSGNLAESETVQQPFAPPNLLEWICTSLRNGKHEDFFALDKLVSAASSEKPASQSFTGHTQKSFSKRFTPRTYLVTELISNFDPKEDSFVKLVETLSEAGVDHHLLNTLPLGVTASFHESIYHVQPNPPTTWNGEILHMVGRDDLSFPASSKQKVSEAPDLQLGPAHEAIRDCHTICNHTTDSEVVDAFDGSQELARKSITRLVFRDDRRYAEASKLLGSLKPTVVRCEPEPDWSEAELLEAQKDLVQIVAIRTLAVPSGRGLFLFSARVPHRTEKYPLFGFNLTCVMRPSGNTVSADKSAFTEEKVCWAFFHAGVSAGLSIAREAKGIDTSWILYNKPNDLSNRHAGFLLALGLNGHLKSIAKWVAFKYLTPKHIMTSIGLLLGLSASYIGTMDSLVTRLLSVHVTRMLPPGAAELNLSPLTQTAGIMGIGLLYCGTQHRRMSEVMLSEVEYLDPDDPSSPVDSLRDEGYRLAAGFALGFINLGRGKDLKGLRDMHIVERLLSLSVGSRKVHLVHVLDRAMAAATVAIALIFMKSNDEVLAAKIDVPDTVLQFDYVRPDIFLLRTLAKHLIMWDSISPSVAWIKSNLPKTPEYAVNASLKKVQRLSSANMALYNIIAGLCLSVGIRFAGSGNESARGLLIHYLDQFIRICRLPSITYDQKLARSTARNCQDVLALSAATVMAGTGDLHVFRRLRSLHGRVDPDTPFGSHLAAHMAIGALFVGGGSYTFGTSDLAASALLCAFYPLFPNDILDNKSHLQAFRHFWVLAVEPRCLVAQDTLTNRPVSVPILVKLKDGQEITRTAPCLLPSIPTISSITTRSIDHWQIVLDFANNESHLSSFIKNQTIYLRRRVAHESSSSAFQANFLSLSDREGDQNPLEWLFGLNAFKNIGRSERALVLPLDTGSAAQISMESTAIDARLLLNGYLASGSRDKLWAIRMILEWAERMNRRGKLVEWLGQGEIERLRGEVWMAADRYS